MGDMIDAVNPANIDATWDGLPAIRITVLGNQLGQAFDGETGDAGPDTVAKAIATRHQRRLWSWLYVNEATEDPYVAALVGYGLYPSPAASFPRLGVYLWCADPSDNIGKGIWTPTTTPVAIQRTYAGTHDLSVTTDNNPVRVAGYLDGPDSAWPGAAWARFTAVSDLAPGPGPNPISDAWARFTAVSDLAPGPGPNPISDLEDQMPFIAADTQHAYLVANDLTRKCIIPDMAEVAILEKVFPALSADIPGTLGAIPLATTSTAAQGPDPT